MTTPRYIDIVEQLSTEVNAMQPGDRLPKERDLAARFATSRMTVRQALGLLVDEGRIYSIRGQGTFVAEPHVAKDATLTSFSQDMLARGHVPSSRLLAAVEVPAPAAVARAEQTFSAAKLSRRQADLLGVPAGSAALVMRRVGADARGRLVEQAESIYRNDRYEFRLGVTRTP